MRSCIILIVLAGTALSQGVTVPESAVPKTTIPAGVPLRVALERRVVPKRTGQPVQGRLVEPVYVYDRVALPAGSVVEGHVAEIGGVPARRRIAAILSGNFTPARDVRAQFDAVVLSDGSRLPIQTSPSRGTAHTARVAARGGKRSEPDAHRSGPPAAAQEKDRAAALAFATPGKMSRLKSELLERLPYRRRAWQPGTLFSGVLRQPLAGLSPAVSEDRGEPPAAGDSQQLSARLLTPVSSATAKRGAAVEAVVTRPVFSPNRELLIPEGSRITGDIVQARAARVFHRNGKVLFVFRQIKLPAGAARGIQGHMAEAEADFDAHLAVDPEGAASARSPKTRFIFPAVAVAVSALSFHQDYNAQGVPDQDIGGRAESGAVGLGLVGTAVAQASRALASGIAIAGAGFSVYTNFLARGDEVTLPANTPIAVSLTARGCEASGGKLEQSAECGEAGPGAKK